MPRDRRKYLPVCKFCMVTLKLDLFSTPRRDADRSQRYLRLSWRDGTLICKALDDCYCTAGAYSFREDIITAAQVTYALTEGKPPSCFMG